MFEVSEGARQRRKGEIKRKKEEKIKKRHWWSKGRMVACHAVDPGSSPGQCNFSFFSFGSIFGHFLCGFFLVAFSHQASTESSVALLHARWQTLLSERKMAGVVEKVRRETNWKQKNGQRKETQE